MERKLLLSDSGFPGKFISSSIPSPTTVPKQQYMEQKVIEAINKHNTKLKISAIEYLKIEDQFPHLDFFEKYYGVIVEDFEIEESQKGLYNDKKYYVWKLESEWFVRKTLIYVLMSLNKEGARNTFIAQSFFPEAIEFIRLYNSSPSFSIANHPIYYINYVDKKITANSIIRDIAGMATSGIENIEVFYKVDQLIDIPENIEKFLIKYDKDFDSTKIPYKTDAFEIDIKNKITKIKIDKLVIGKYLKYKNGFGSEYQFKASDEKLYWMKIVPIIILSWKNKYTIDYTMLEDFYNQNKNHFASDDEKFERFSILIQFIKKIILEGK